MNIEGKAKQDFLTLDGVLPGTCVTIHNKAGAWLVTDGHDHELGYLLVNLHDGRAVHFARMTRCDTVPGARVELG